MSGKRRQKRYPPLPVVLVVHILPTRWSKYLESRFDDDLMDFEREIIEHWMRVSKVLLPHRGMGWSDGADTLQPSQWPGREEIIAARNARRDEMYRDYLEGRSDIHKCVRPAPPTAPPTEIIPEWLKYLDEFNPYLFKKDPLL